MSIGMDFVIFIVTIITVWGEQEQVSKLHVGSMPRSMWVTLEDDLVDSCKPGDDVVVW